MPSECVNTVAAHRRGWALLTEKQDFDTKKMMGKYKPMNLAGQALAAINK